MSRAHPRVLGYLGRALSLELTAVQQYMTQASLAELWGEAHAADRFRRETVEEMQHAERIVRRLLSLGAAPAASQLQPVRHGSDLVALLRGDALLEDQLIRHYEEAAQFCDWISNGDDGAFFRDLWNDEQHHAQELNTWLRELGGHNGAAPERATF
jgi:bacterioferritin